MLEKQPQIPEGLEECSYLELNERRLGLKNPRGHTFYLQGAAITQVEPVVTMQKFEPNLPFVSYFQEKPEI